MSYRDDLGAARTRIRELEAKLGEKDERIAELEAEKKRPAKPKKTRSASSGPRQLFGKLYFQRPWRYFPLWEILKQGVVAAPRIKVPKPKSNSLMAWVGYYGMRLPLFYGLFLPFFYLVLVPYFIGLGSLISPFILVWMVLAGLKVGPAPKRARETGANALTGSGAVLAIVMLGLTTAGVVAGIVLSVVGSCSSSASP